MFWPGIFGVLGHNRRCAHSVYREQTRETTSDFVDAVDLFILLHIDRTDRRFLDGLEKHHFLDAGNTLSHHYVRVVVRDSADPVDTSHRNLPNEVSEKTDWFLREIRELVSRISATSFVMTGRLKVIIYNFILNTNIFISMCLDFKIHNIIAPRH